MSTGKDRILNYFVRMGLAPGDYPNPDAMLDTHEQAQRAWQRARQDGLTDDDFVHVWVVWAPDAGIHGVYTSGALADDVDAKLPVGFGYRVEKHRLQGWLVRQET